RPAVRPRLDDRYAGKGADDGARCNRGAAPATAVHPPPDPPGEAVAALSGHDLDDLDRLFDALQSLDPAVQIGDALDPAGQVDERLAGQHLTAARRRAQPRGHVQRATPVVVAYLHGLAGVEADTDAQRKAVRGDRCLDPQRRPQRAPRRLEHADHVVAVGRHHAAVELLDLDRRQPDEPLAELRGGIVAVLL